MAIAHKPPGELFLNEHDRLIFLAGPIQGAPDWQAQALHLIDDIAPFQAVHVANPRIERIDGYFDKNAQIAWEKQALRRASRNGAIVFWLAARDFSLPYTKGRPYAQTTRLEFGRAAGWRDYNPSIRIALGMHPDYKGNEDYYRHTAAELQLPVFDTIEETVDYALRRS